MAGTAALMLSSLAQGSAQADMTKTMGDYSAKIGDLNARKAEIASAEAIDRGNKEAAKFGTKVSQMAGSQKAALAAQGISIDSGSAADIVNQTYAMGAEDAQTIRSNAFREALGYKSAASQYRIEGELSQQSANIQANQTLLGAGIRAFGYAQAGGYLDGKVSLSKKEDQRL